MYPTVCVLSDCLHLVAALPLLVVLNGASGAEHGNRARLILWRPVVPQFRHNQGYMFTTRITSDFGAIGTLRHYQGRGSGKWRRWFVATDAPQLAKDGEQPDLSAPPVTT